MRNAANVLIPPAMVDRFGFNARWGYVADRDAGTYYCQNRNYAPGWGKSIERDPIGFEGGMNSYAYCAGQPVGSADPNGLFWMRSPAGTMFWIPDAPSSKPPKHYKLKLSQEHCKKLRLEIIDLMGKLFYEIQKYSPTIDPMGSAAFSGYEGGLFKPNGHETETRGYQRGIQNRLDDLAYRCGPEPPKGPPPSPATQSCPKPDWGGFLLQELEKFSPFFFPIFGGRGLSPQLGPRFGPMPPGIGMPPFTAELKRTDKLRHLWSKPRVRPS